MWVSKVSLIIINNAFTHEAVILHVVYYSAVDITVIVAGVLRTRLENVEQQSLNKLLR